MFSDVLEEFLTYAVSLEYDTEPDYEKCRKMFKDALKKAKYPLDGKIDFTSPKKVKKVGRTSSPVKQPAVKRKASVASKKALRISDSSASSSEDDEDSFQEASSAARKSKASPQKRSKKAAVLTKDAECQTSPAFVKAAKRQRRALASKVANNPEMEDFAKMAIDSAKKASAKKTASSPRKSGGKVEKSKVKNDEASLENPTPAMLALLAKKAEAESAKKKTKKKA